MNHLSRLKKARLGIGLLMLALMLGGTAFGQAGKTIIINHFVSDPAVIDGYLVVADVAGKGGSVNLAFYDENGNLAGSGKETFPAHGKINVNPEKYVKGKKMIGTIRATSSQLITGQYWQFYKDASLGWKNIAVPAAPAPGSSRLVCQHFVSDPSEVESYIVVANGGTKPLTVYIDMYSDNGDLVSQTSRPIAGNGKISLIPSDIVGGKKMTGVAYIQADGGMITGEYWQVSPGEKYQVAHALQGSGILADDVADNDPMRVMINFDFDSDKIQPRSFADLNEVAKAMNGASLKTTNFEVGGFTDDKGKADYNQKLSERRATAVKNYLVKKGKVKANRLVIKGYGPANPLVPNDSELNRARNRRVEFKRMK